MLVILLPPGCYALSLILLWDPSALQVTGEALTSWFWAQV